MNHDYELLEKRWIAERDRVMKETIMRGYSLGICNDKTGECMYVIPGRGVKL